MARRAKAVEPAAEITAETAVLAEAANELDGNFSSSVALKGFIRAVAAVVDLQTAIEIAKQCKIERAYIEDVRL